MAVYYPTVINSVSGTQVEVRGVTNMKALLNSTVDTTYNIIGMQIYMPNNVVKQFPIYYNIKDADGSLSNRVIDKVFSPNQKQNTLVARIEGGAQIDINNFFSTKIQAGGTVQFKLYHAAGISGSMELRELVNDNVLNGDEFNNELND